MSGLSNKRDGLTDTDARRESERFDKLVAIELDEEEKEMLISGLADWGGPADGSDALAVAMGFASMLQLSNDVPKLVAAIERGRGLSIRDWTKVLVAVEIAFVSEVLGTGLREWDAINGGDRDWLAVLRRLQSKLPHDPMALPS